ncbi:2-phosphosulfolactate phosphatase [Actinotalea sp. K2]|uniref:2-phosphosulfolactate phosphatase n=1 Tax=Actinotalea sp. K2 TaxID=2939438 RepID=UPI00201751CC|nr:2-phosphosulfolactate phosphatase [Actinotalea sp. K2]MCL3859466.1 2-phosphosulfolactate phosphatase [Actinotalea sp. K2]
MHTALEQLPFKVRMEWGLDGAEAIGRTDVAIVVDVLSFSTCVSVAADAGISVLPYRWAADGAAAYATKHGAVLAVGRSQAGPGQISLSPGSIRAAEGVTRLVLPSPNGSTIAAHLFERGSRVLAGSLRNAGALAEWLTEAHGPDGATVAVIAAGERWPGGGMRPAVEDLWGAGAVVSALHAAGWTSASPEATTAAGAFHDVRSDLVARLVACASGAELLAMGYPDDIAVAAELGTSRSVPLLDETGFRPSAP